MRPVLFYDPEYKLTRARVARWNYLTIHNVEYVPYDDSDGILPMSLGAPPQLERETCFHLVEEDGSIRKNGAAAARLWKYMPRHEWKHAIYERAPALQRWMDAWYAWSADHRDAADRIHWIFSGLDEDHAGAYVTRWMFLRLMAVIYVIAFASFWWQAIGLIGSEGIYPAETYIEGVRSGMTADDPIRAYKHYPTFLVFNSSDAAIHAVCGAGLVAGILLLVGFFPQLAALACWLAYLSIFVASPEFLSYQWDALLLEVGFLTIFFAPLEFRSGPFTRSVPSTGMLWMLRILCARLMWSSGIVKLNDGVWRDFTALTYHYETQPLPTIVGWYAHHLPLIAHQASCVIMFIIEIGLPILVFGPRRLRQLAGRGFILLMILIIATGNYGFFNLLTIALAITLFDDGFLRKLISGTAFARIAPPPVRQLPAWPRYFVVIAVIAITLPLQVYFAGLLVSPRLVSPLREYRIALNPYHIASGYGLFSNMTTTRPEIIIEGSNDGATWQAYEWPFKPGALDDAPRWSQPHMPRIDWNLWFEALNADAGGRPTIWFQNLMVRLMQGEENVVRLVGENPFPDDPPRYIRAKLYTYHFTTQEEKEETGEWWKREEKKTYFGPVALE